MPTLFIVQPVIIVISARGTFATLNKWDFGPFWVSHCIRSIYMLCYGLDILSWFLIYKMNSIDFIVEIKSIFETMLESLTLDNSSVYWIYFLNFISHLPAIVLRFVNMIYIERI